MLREGDLRKTKMNNASPSRLPEDTSSNGLRVSAAASLLGVLLIGSIGGALAIDESERAASHTLPTIIVQRVLTVTPLPPMRENVAEPSGEAPASTGQAAAPAPADNPATPVEGKAVSTPPVEVAAPPATAAAAERLAEQPVAEERETIAEEPRRSGGGGGNALGYDIWSPLLDGSIGMRQTADSESEVARIRQPRRGLRPFSDANHG